MSNEAGSSSRAVNKQAEIHEEEVKPVEVLLDFVDKREHREFSSIFKVPNTLREANPSSFTPRVVSIGPLHKKAQNLKLMEDKKAEYLDQLLEKLSYGKETFSREETLTKCWDKVMGSIKNIRRCYIGMEETYTDDQLVQMMVLDACFILQYLNNLSKKGDPHSENRLRSRSLALDLVLLENQIPFFVLQDIYDLTFKTIESKPTLDTMLLDLLERVNPFSEKLKLANLSGKETPYHILGFLHDFYQTGVNPPNREKIPTAHSAVELHKVGVRFRPKVLIEYQSTTWIMAMEFEKSSHKPTFRMPKVLIDNFFEVALRNLIAYEQYSTPVKNYVQSYAMAMDMLAATPADIARLAKSGVIVNHLGSNEKASNMISSICKDVAFLDFYYIDSWQRAKKHYDSYWYKNIGVLKRKHFSTPWNAMALVAGIVLFLTGVAGFVLRVITFAKLY